MMGRFRQSGMTGSYDTNSSHQSHYRLRASGRKSKPPVNVTDHRPTVARSSTYCFASWVTYKRLSDEIVDRPSHDFQSGNQVSLQWHTVILNCRFDYDRSEKEPVVGGPNRKEKRTFIRRYRDNRTKIFSLQSENILMKRLPSVKQNIYQALTMMWCYLLYGSQRLKLHPRPHFTGFSTSDF